MKLYKFSPIKNKQELFEAIEHIHFSSCALSKQSFGKVLNNSGNIGIFCHYNDEYEHLIGIRKEITYESDNPDQKYFELIDPIVIPAKKDIPETVYTHLYIRKPDPYRHHAGDIDFYLNDNEYSELKNRMLGGLQIPGARIFDRPDLDMIELHNPDIDVLAYVSMDSMTKKVRVKQSDITKL